MNHVFTTLFLAVSCTSAVVAPATVDTGEPSKLEPPADTGPTQMTDDTGMPTPIEPALITDPLHGLPTGTTQWTSLCARGYSDPIAEAFCTSVAAPSIDGIATLRTLLGLDGDFVGGVSGTVSLAAVHHSSAVGGRLVTPLTPRVFFVHQPPVLDEPYLVMAFGRGEPLVEFVTRDGVTGDPRFYLLRFNLACETTSEGCALADLLTVDVESNWTDWSLYDDSDVASTTLDCLRCHQPDGPGTPRFLLMQEQRFPWNHWFNPFTAENVAAVSAFQDAHGDSTYASVPVEDYSPITPRAVETLVDLYNPEVQPRIYDSLAINQELSVGTTSPTWEALFADAVGATPVPYAGNPIVDGNWDFSNPSAPVIDDASPFGQAVATFRGVVDGSVPPEQMPDPRNLWLPEALVGARHRAQPGLDAGELLQDMCGACHNDRLDPTLPRAAFDVGRLGEMTRAEKDGVIERLQLPERDVRRMPPARFHTLREAERDVLVAELQQ